MYHRPIRRECGRSLLKLQIIEGSFELVSCPCTKKVGNLFLCTFQWKIVDYGVRKWCPLNERLGVWAELNVIQSARRYCYLPIHYLPLGTYLTFLFLIYREYHFCNTPRLSRHRRFGATSNIFEFFSEHAQNDLRF